MPFLYALPGSASQAISIKRGYKSAITAALMKNGHSTVARVQTLPKPVWRRQFYIIWSRSQIFYKIIILLSVLIFKSNHVAKRTTSTMLNFWKRYLHENDHCIACDNERLTLLNKGISTKLSISLFSRLDLKYCC